MIVQLLIKFRMEILVVILLIVCASSIRQCSVNADNRDLAINAKDSAFLVAKYYQTKNGELVGQVNTHEMTIGQLKRYGGEMGFRVKELEQQVGNSNRLVAHWRGKANMSGAAVVALSDVNSFDPSMDLSGESINLEMPGALNDKQFTWGNNHLQLNGIVDFDSSLVKIRYQYSTDFSLTAYRKPQGLFKRPQLVADIWFDDPNMKVREFKGFVIQEPRRRFYQTNLFRVSIALGAGFVLGKAL
jgi:hypothetical protein